MIRQGLGNTAVKSDNSATAPGMSLRTIYLRMQDQGSARNAVREDIIFKLTKASLSTSVAPIAHITRVLGYSDSTAFKRLSVTAALQYCKILSEE